MLKCWNIEIFDTHYPANKGNVFFSNESNFYVSGMTNKHNCRGWSANSPFMTVEAAMSSPKINV